MQQSYVADGQHQSRHPNKGLPPPYHLGEGAGRQRPKHGAHEEEPHRQAGKGLGYAQGLYSVEGIEGEEGGEDHRHSHLAPGYQPQHLVSSEDAGGVADLGRRASLLLRASTLPAEEDPDYR